MKPSSFFTCFFIFCCCFTTFAQSDFAAIGTQWTYTQWVPGPNPAIGSQHPYYMKVDSEVVFQNRLCRRLIGGRAGQPQVPLFYLYNQGDSIFCWNSYNDRFNLLYDFTAETGDSWEIEMPQGSLPGGDTIITISVDSTGYTIQNNDTLKVWYITHSGGVYWANTMIEGIGNTCYFFPTPDIYEPDICALRCFENALTDINFVNYPCDTIISGMISSNEAPTSSESIKIYPNPSSDQAVLEYPFWNGAVLHLELYDLTGKQVRSERLDNNGTYTFDTSGLPDGIYLLRLLCNGRVVKNMKLSILQ